MSTIYAFHNEPPALTSDGLAANDIIPVYDTSAGVVKRALISDIGSFGNSAVAAGSALTLTKASHSGKTIQLDTAAGSTVTLPAATGSGAKFKFYISVVATSNSHKIQVASGTDFFVGSIAGVSDDPATVKGWIAANSGTVATNSDTITLNRSTTGSVSVGEWIEVEDVATATWLVRGMITQTGTEATPFSAAV